PCPQLACRVVAHVAEFVDHRSDAFDGRDGDSVGAVQHVRHGADGHASALCHVADTDGHLSSRTLSKDPIAPARPPPTPPASAPPAAPASAPPVHNDANPLSDRAITRFNGHLGTKLASSCMWVCGRGCFRRPDLPIMK